MWTPGDVSGLQVLDPSLDHLFASHINELRSASDSEQAQLDAAVASLASLSTSLAALTNSTNSQIATLTSAIDIVARRHPIYNIEADFGAVGDGVTDNKDAYAAARTALLASNGGTVVFNGKTYFSSRPFVPTSFTTVQGMGMDKTVLLQSSASTGGNGDVIRLSNDSAPYSQRVTIKDLTCDCSLTYPNGEYGNMLNSYSNGVTMQGVHDVVVENVKVIKPTGYGVQISSPAGKAPYVYRPVVKNLHVLGERGGQDSLGGGGIVAGVIDGLYVYPAADGTNPYGTITDWTNHRGTTIRNVRGWTTFVYGINARTTPSVPATNTELVNPYAYPLTVTLSGGTYTDVKINNVSAGTGGTYTLPGFGTISITYSVAPTWTWTAPTAPAVPASNVAATNPFAFPVPVTITGGTVSAVAINGTTQGTTSGYFLVPVGGTITVTYTVAPTWSWLTKSGSAGIETDFGCWDVLYENIYINGFENGMLIDKVANQPSTGNVTIRDPKIFNVAYNGIKAAVQNGLGIEGFVVEDGYLNAYGMLGAAPAINLIGTRRFTVRGNKFGRGGVTSFAIALNTDGVNACDFGVITENDVSVEPFYGFIAASGALGSNVYIGNNPGLNDSFGWSVVPANATSTGTPGQKAYDGSYFYLCVATNSWKRVAVAAW